MAIDKINTTAITSISELIGITKSSIASISGQDLPSAVTLLLDTYTGAAAAYSFRELNSSYSGDCVRVQNDSGTNLDVGFVNNYLDTASIATLLDRDWETAAPV